MAALLIRWIACFVSCNILDYWASTIVGEQSAQTTRSTDAEAADSAGYRAERDTIGRLGNRS